MRKSTLTLAILVGVLLVINSAFILIVQLSKTDSDLSNLEGNVIVGEILNKGKLNLFEESVERSISISRDKEVISDENPLEKSVESRIETIEGDNGFLAFVDYDKGTFTINGREIPIIVDEIIDSNGNPVKEDVLSKSTAAENWIYLPYERFDAYIEENYYNANTPEIDNFLDQFEVRYALMEAQTGWSSEKFYGVKLKINVSSTIGCFGGSSLPARANIYFSDPLYNSGCERQYYEEGSPMYGNTGELGDNWGYMQTALHEALHAINPLSIFVRTWLTEGYSQYEGYNILSTQGDINQETVDTYLEEGTAPWNWQDYVANDYHDTTAYNREIQESAGYDITAWMYSMLRDDYSLNFGGLYNIIDNNHETLDKADSMYMTSDYFTDMVMIDLFGKGIGYDSPSIKDVFEYNSPSGPGWGVRQWVDTSWYADLKPVNFGLSPPSTTPTQEVNVLATISNLGDTDLKNVLVKFTYEDVTVLEESFYEEVGGEESLTTLVSPDEVGFYEEYVDIDAQSSVVVTTTYGNKAGDYIIRVYADPEDIKLESDESNNMMAQEFSIGLGSLEGCTTGTYDKDGNYVAGNCA